MNITRQHILSRSSRIVSLGAIAALLILGSSVIPAQAQGRQRDRDRRDDRNDRYDRDHRDGRRDNGRFNVGDMRRFAFANGYSEGFDDGLRDRRSRRRSNYKGTQTYRDGRRGFRFDRRYQNDYQKFFRQGYAKGYSDGFYGRSRSRSYDRDRQWRYNDYPGYSNGSYGGGYPGGYYDNGRGDLSAQEVAERAARNGYYAGFQRGAYDVQRSNRPNPQGHGAYQFGYDGYDREWGSAHIYQQTYRQYFVQGYNDAFSRRSFNRRYDRRF